MAKIQVYEVQDDVPVPIDILRVLREMEKGQSFTFPPERRRTVATYASKVRKETGHKFVLRVEDNIGRVWRAE